MKTTVKLFATALLLAGTGNALATTHYVDVNSTNATPPYTSWATAATNIQDAVDAAVAGDEIVVTNGIYATGGRATVADNTINRVKVDKPLTLRSVNGPQFTIIAGGNPGRCVYLTNGASLSGFTLTGGRVEQDNAMRRRQGGGLWCESTNAVVSNCVVSGNSAEPNPFSGGVGLSEGGGAYGGTLNNCTLSGNSASVELRPYITYSRGGGAAYCTLNNCTLTNNSACAPSGSVDTYSQGGGAYRCTLNNCTLSHNRVWDCPGNFIKDVHNFGGGAYDSTLNNCTLTGNYDGGAYQSTLKNCVVYFNTSSQEANYYSCTLNYSCTTPQPTTGVGNITNAPLFVDQAAGNLRLQSNSPCINAGNNSYVTSATDLDGNPRIAGGTVDIGAYEFQSPASMISYAWLQQFNLPINPSTDTADPDGDGVNNYHEWLAGSDPTNPFSFPPLLTLIPYGATVILTWPTNAVGFTLQSATNLGAVWSTNSPGPVVIGGQNVVINPISGPQQFYRLSQ